MYITHLPTGTAFTVLPNPFYILSVDPGSTNLGIRIEKRFITGKIEAIFFHVLNLRESEFHEILTSVLNVLDDMMKWIKKCHIIIIEQQISKINPKITRVFERMLSYLIVKLERSRLNPKIFELDSKAVKRFFGMPRGKNKKIKEYVAICSEKILERGGDQESLDKLRGLSKALRNQLDDVVGQIETICQLEKYVTVLSSKNIQTLQKKYKNL